MLHHLLIDGTLVEVDQFELTTQADAPALVAWLEAVLLTTAQMKPTPREILRLLGADSPAIALDRADLADIYDACRSDPEIQLKRELWSRLLTAALGTNFEDNDELFVTHTYLVLTAELIAHSVAGIPVSAAGNVRPLLEGQQFELAGLHGVVEADFFDWPALRPEGALVVRAIARRLARFDWTQVEHDILKALYESVIDTETRHRLGEYYTPDWLANRMVETQVTEPMTDRVLDPACGSGTFLFWAVRRVLTALDAAGASNRDALDHVVAHVAGVDLHPVAVTLARVTYLLAIGRDRLGDRRALTIPVFLGDSVRWEQDASLLQQGGITVKTSDGMELFAQELHFPEGVLEDPGRFDRLVAALADKAADPHRAPVEPRRRKDNKPSTKPSKVPDISALLKANQVPVQDRSAVQTVFEKLCRLHDAGRDHVWGYYIRNLARPLSFTRPGQHADVLVGNPPWLAYRHMPAPTQARYEALAKPRGLWAGGKNATHQDLSDLFVVRAVEQYLRPGGRFAFVMPFAVLSRRQYAGFRSGHYSSHGAGESAVSFGSAESYEHVKPPLFPVPACVVPGERSEKPTSLSTVGVTWHGRVPDHHMDWASASGHLHPTATSVARARDDAAASAYKAAFQQGATFTPRVLITVRREDAGPLGIVSGSTRVRSARSSLEKAPWRDVHGIEGVVENDFLYTMYSGATIVAFRARDPELAVIPRVDGKLIDGRNPAMDAHQGLADWWRTAERRWERHKSSRSSLSLLDRIDFQRGLRKQFPVPSRRVVYTTSGQYLAACRIDDPHAVIDTSLYWAPVRSADEGRYLTAVLNSDALLQLVRPLQSRGEHNPRHFHLVPMDVPTPVFDGSNALHTELVDLAKRAEMVAAGVQLDSARRFELARRQVREALVATGLAAELDDAVNRLLR